MSSNISKELLEELQVYRKEIDKLVSVSINNANGKANNIVPGVKDTKVLYRTETIEVWPMFTNSGYYHARFPNGSVFYVEKEYLENQYEWNGKLSFSHALHAMRCGKVVKSGDLCMKIMHNDFYHKLDHESDYEWYRFDNDNFHLDIIMYDNWEIVE